ncbi:MAG TPA: menaquinone biosynthesis protein [Phycisphaerae bacterium]|nr:menaquinone biosynthesis protein [Phycisphaerae bacterium]
MNPQSPDRFRLGIVQFLNSRPLIEGLEDRPDIELHFAVPSALAHMLRTGQVDASLVPVIDLARAGGAWEQVSDAGIACDGETLTVRVFSRVPAEEMTHLHLDTDSHTSVVLAQLIWKHWFRRRLEVQPLAEANSLDRCESVLLIGDKVATTPSDAFAHCIDLGSVWKKWTGFPFVFAVWASPTGRPGNAELGDLLSRARDLGVSRAAELAKKHAPPRGWPTDLALRYMTDCLKYTITPAAYQGMRKFITLATEEGFVREQETVSS